MISILFSAGPLAFIVIFGSLVATMAVQEVGEALGADKGGEGAGGGGVVAAEPPYGPRR